MIRYLYQCPMCNIMTEKLRPMDERNNLPVCECGMIMDRKYEAPYMQIGKPANTDSDRDDKFWDNAERLRLKREAKRKAEQLEKYRYGDKETIKKEENKMKNYMQTDNKHFALEVEKKLDKITKRKLKGNVK